jgi:hypothetical protein
MNDKRNDIRYLICNFSYTKFEKQNDIFNDIVRKHVCIENDYSNIHDHHPVQIRVWGEVQRLVYTQVGGTVGDLIKDEMQNE